MNIDGEHFQTIWFDQADHNVKIIDQTKLPHFFSIIALNNLDDACHAIKSMQVRGAPLIGATAAYGLYLALREYPDELKSAAKKLIATRPTAVNLQWAVDRVCRAVEQSTNDAEVVAFEQAQAICKEDVENCFAIGGYGLELLRKLHQQKDDVINVLTHCNAGWLATVDWGTALAPIYRAHEEGLPIHVWVDETRPRNQGASLTAWELGKQGISHTVISDNAGGHLMQTGRVDFCLMGSDRTSYKGDVGNKIGTYLKALAAHDNNVPFYIALPVSSIDWESESIPIEERDGEEVSYIYGLNSQGRLDRVRVTPEGSPSLNHAFDVTPGRLVTGLITEKGVYSADITGLQALKNTLDV
jgi:methylthioribose-1-phosphate isomerase